MIRIKEEEKIKKKKKTQNGQACVHDGNMFLFVLFFYKIFYNFDSV